MSKLKLPIPSLMSRNLPIKVFHWSDLTMEKLLGTGSYSEVKLYSTLEGERVAVKEFRNFCSTKGIVKEAAILGKLHHPNIAKLIAFSDSEPAGLMMEYVSFDMSIFGLVEEISCLDKLLYRFDEYNFEQLEHVQISITKGLVNGLHFLHENNIAHRDLKPQNILVTNGRDWSSDPVCVKFADFGESRSLLIQTNTVNESATSNIYRGTPSYMAPEILKQKHIEKFGFVSKTIDDLKLMDVWSMAMVLQMLLNPDLSSPFELDLNKAICYGDLNQMECVIIHTLERGLPSMSKKYEKFLAKEWNCVYKIYKFCAVVDPEARPDITVVKRFMDEYVEDTNIDILKSLISSTVSFNSSLPHKSIKPSPVGIEFDDSSLSQDRTKSQQIPRTVGQSSGIEFDDSSLSQNRTKSQQIPRAVGQSSGIEFDDSSLSQNRTKSQQIPRAVGQSSGIEFDDSSLSQNRTKSQQIPRAVGQSSGIEFDDSSLSQNRQEIDDSSYAGGHNTTKSHWKSKFLHPYFWHSCLVEDQIPFDVNGKRRFSIKCDKSNMMVLSRDGRPWKTWMQSKRSEFAGIRRIASCKGSPICRCESCKIDGEFNRFQFQRNSGNCRICGEKSEMLPCFATKIWEFHNNQLDVFYNGQHTCVAKKLKTSKEQILNLFERNPTATAACAVSSELSKLLTADEIDWDKVSETADCFVNRRQLDNARAAMKTSIHSFGHSFDAVSVFKRECDKRDRFLIYCVNNEEFNNGQPTYVFKSSKVMADIALKMDRFVGTLNNTYAHLDVKHDRVKGLKTVTLWIYHDKIRQVLNVAVMDVLQENGENLQLFWTTLNNMLRDASCTDTVIFNPIGFVVDEHAANWTSIEEVYGSEAVKRTFSCEFHFKQSLIKHSRKVSDGAQFKAIGNSMLEALTPNLYAVAYEQMKAFSIAHGNILDSWLTWWNTRKRHIFRAYKPLDAPNVNLAEVGHAKMANENERQLFLIAACRADVIRFVRQEAQLKGFSEGMTTGGRGPNSKQRKAVLYRKQMQYAKAIANEIAVVDDDDDELESDTCFVAKEGIHRPAESVKKGVKRKHNKSYTEKKKRSVNKQHLHKDFNMRGPVFTEPYHNDSPFYFELNTGTKKCIGCNIALQRNAEVPNNLIVAHNERFGYPDGKGNFIYSKSRTRNMSYHAMPQCIVDRHPYFTVTSLAITNTVKEKLQDDHYASIQNKFGIELDDVKVIIGL